ncbi:MAG: hypothetical protein R3223_09960, partial [Longimicrobiales bacterium]|nr:hypothetical protein [Longimicrobiales bacterium]
MSHPRRAPRNRAPGSALERLPVHRPLPSPTVAALIFLWCIGVALPWAPRAAAQLPSDGDGTGDPLPSDSTELRERAHEIQARFEAYRESRIPPSTVTGRSSCDERIGRFCLRHDGDEAPIPPEPPEVA